MEYKKLNILNYAYENLEVISYSAICFFTPFLLGHPQYVVGVVVNAMLILAALRIGKYGVLPVIMLPSLGVLSRGLIFGPYTPLLAYMIPFIWLGNGILVYSIKKIVAEKKFNKWLGLGAGTVAKTAFLFTMASVFVTFGLIPSIFLTSMGILQLATAIGGGIIAFGIHKIYESKSY